MGIIFVLLPISLALGLGGFLAFLWALRSGQFDDLESPPMKLLFRDENDNKDE